MRGYDAQGRLKTLTTYQSGITDEASFATATGYAPINLESNELMDPELRKTLPDMQADTQVNANMDYWADHRDEIGTRWYAWQAQ